MPVDSVQLGLDTKTLTSVLLILNINDTTDRVSLTVSIQWDGNAANLSGRIPITVKFSIERRRMGETTFTNICTFSDYAYTFVRAGAFLPSTTTSFTCVDSQPIIAAGQQQVEYIVTASSDFGDPVLVSLLFGTFTGAEQTHRVLGFQTIACMQSSFYV